MNKSSQTKIVFFGTPDFAVPALEVLAHDGYDVCAVVTSPDRPKGRGLTVTSSPAKIAANRLEIPVLEFETLRGDEAQKAIKEINADVFLVAAYGKILPETILKIPPRGALNIHPSLLPKYRGASPIENVILHGDHETGVSFMLMDVELDHGPIVNQVKIPIEPNENAITLSKKLSLVSARLVHETLPRWLEGSIAPSPQNHSEATFTKPLNREDGHLDWKKSAEELERQVRAYLRWPRSYTLWQKGSNVLRLKIEAAEVIEGRGLAPGTVWQDSLTVEAKNGALRILKIRPEGRQSMSAEEFLRGHQSILGSTLK